MESSAIDLLLNFSRSVAQAFFSGLWQGCALIAAVVLSLRLLPRISASLRFVIWAWAFALLLFVPLLHLASPHTSAASSTGVQLGTTWAVATAALWASLMAVRAVQLAVQMLRLRRIWIDAHPVSPDPATLPLLIAGSRTAELCTSPDVDSPSVIGFFRPRLLLPEWLFAQLTEPELRQIVLHEREHLRRYDDWINLLQKIGLVLFPLNPALLWVDRRLGLERELACDAGVVAATAAPFSYAHSLTRLAEHRLHPRTIALTLSAWTRQTELARRVRSLLQPVRRSSPRQARVSAALLSLALAGGAVAMARAPRLVSFTEAATPTAPVAEVSPSVPAPAAIVPVVYREPARPHAPVRSTVTTSARMSPLRPASLRTRTVRARSVSSQPRLVRTSAISGARRPLLIPTAYAAIPFGDGWLIVQL